MRRQDFDAFVQEIALRISDGAWLTPALVLRAQGETKLVPLPEEWKGAPGPVLRRVQFELTPSLLASERDVEAVAVVVEGSAAASRVLAIDASDGDRSVTLRARRGGGPLRFQVQPFDADRNLVYVVWPLVGRGRLRGPGGSDAAAAGLLPQVVAREGVHGADGLEAFAPLLRGRSPAEQVLLFSGMEISAALRRHDLLQPLLDRLAARAYLYWPRDSEADPEDTLGRAFANLYTGLYVPESLFQVGPLLETLAEFRAWLREGDGEFGTPYLLLHRAELGNRAEQELGQVLREEGLPDRDERGLPLLLGEELEWVSELLWLGECADEGELVLGERERRPLPEHEPDALRALLRTRRFATLIGAEPLLAARLPAPSELLREADAERLAASLPAFDPELAQRCEHDILHERHFALDHLALVDCDGFGIRRVSLAPEQRFLDIDDDGRPSMEGFTLRCLIEHTLGVFACELYALHVPDGGEDPIDAAHLGVKLWPTLRGDAAALVEQGAWMVCATLWRNLVVADTREEQYEQQVVRALKAKRKRADDPRARRRGQVEVISYVPRRLVLRRAEERERKVGGQPTLRRAFRVGNFSKLLPQGQHRSYEADAYARLIGMPLKPGETVVKAHARGGTAEERQLLEEEGETALRHWRSWSAFDLLLTRAHRANG